eukprot:g11103.t1
MLGPPGPTPNVDYTQLTRDWKLDNQECPPRYGLLKQLHPILIPDLLHVLRSAGHGDNIVLVDCNFPAAQVATSTVTGKHIILAGVDLTQGLDAICSVMPLDFFANKAAQIMTPSPGASYPILAQEAHHDVRRVISERSHGIGVFDLERFAFYEEAKRSFAVVQCVGERRPYANVILTKGVVGPDGNDLKP